MIRMTVPEIVDYDLLRLGAFHNCVIVSVRKAFLPRAQGHARDLGPGMLSLSKSVVDEHIDVHDYEQVFFHVCANVDPKRDGRAHRRPARPAGPRGDAALLRQVSSGIDATHKWPEEGARVA